MSVSTVTYNYISRQIDERGKPEQARIASNTWENTVAIHQNGTQANKFRDYSQTFLARVGIAQVCPRNIYQCLKYPPVIGHFLDILLLCLDKIAFDWTNYLISYENYTTQYSNLTVRLITCISQEQNTVTSQ